MSESTGHPPFDTGTIVRRTSKTTGHPGWLLCFVKDGATLSMHFSDIQHGGSALSRAAAQRVLKDLGPLFPEARPPHTTAR